MGTAQELKPPAPCIILGAGEMLDYAAARRELPASAFTICADGGLRHCQQLALTPHLLVGDFDSLGPPPEGIPAIPLSPEKNYTDTTHAVEEALDRGYTRLHLLGMLGGRLDHSLANLQTLGYCASRGVYATISDGVTRVYALSDRMPPLVLEPREEHYFSLLSLVDACAGVRILGGKYPLEDYPLSCLEARAISNEFTGQPVTVSLKKGILLVTVLPKDRCR